MGIIQFGLRRLRSNVRDILYRIRPSIDRTVSINNLTATFSQSTDTERIAISHIQKERNVISDILDSLSPEDCFLDIGGNIGQFACFIGQEIETHSIEPYLPSYHSLENNFESNDCLGEIYNQAVSTQDEVILSVPLLPKPGWQTPSTEGFGRSLSISGVSGAVLTDEISPTIMKIDVEGAEEDVLSSFNDLHQFEMIYVEIHEKHWRRGETNSSKVNDILHDAGFTLEVFEDREMEKVIKATK